MPLSPEQAKAVVSYEVARVIYVCSLSVSYSLGENSSCAQADYVKATSGPELSAQGLAPVLRASLSKKIELLSVRERLAGVQVM